MVVEKEGFGAAKNYNMLLFSYLVIIVKKHRLYNNSLQYTRDVYINILKINNVKSSNNT